MDLGKVSPLDLILQQKRSLSIGPLTTTHPLEFLNSLKLCQTWAEPVIFLPWVEPDPNLELLGRNQ